MKISNLVYFSFLKCISKVLILKNLSNYIIYNIYLYLIIIYNKSYNKNKI